MHTSLLAELAALTAQWEVHETVPASTDAVAELLLAVREGRVGDDNLLVLAGASTARLGAMTVVAGPGPGRYRAEFAGQVEPVRIEVGRTALAVQSWYAGVHEVTATPAGALVTHRVHRVDAHHPGFAPGIAELGLRARMARDLGRVLAVIADRLGC
ncbi:hypothetical protein [Kribbella sp. NPDC004875]|uniref:hypothetical protein n=1 Tax=Kribbella sp. NPDC004875 TaxID=3364107 RepID=UPI0036C17FBE